MKVILFATALILANIFAIAQMFSTNLAQQREQSRGSEHATSYA